MLDFVLSDSSRFVADTREFRLGCIFIFYFSRGHTDARTHQKSDLSHRTQIVCASVSLSWVLTLYSRVRRASLFFF